MPRSATSPRPYAIGAACVFLFVFTGLLVDAGRQKGPAADHDFRLRVLILSVMAVGCLVAAWTSWGVVSVLLRPKPRADAEDYGDEPPRRAPDRPGPA